MSKRTERLLPDGKPRYIHCYDNGGVEKEGGTIDRYTVVYTRTGRSGSNRDKKVNGWHQYVTMSSTPFYPQGVCLHSESQNPIDWPTYGHLGKKISFDRLPLDCQNVVMEDYMEIWGLKRDVA